VWGELSPRQLEVVGLAVRQVCQGGRDAREGRHLMAYSLTNGVFSLDTFVTVQGQSEHIVLSLDLGHSEIRAMVHQAINSRGRRSSRANGALVIRAQGERRLPAMPAPEDDWEGPQAPEYAERDDEAHDEMVRQDQEGKS
jgi:hypothetical protein